MALPSPALPLRDPERGTVPYLLIVKGEEQSVLLLERSPITIGRKPEKDIFINDARMSREHAQIVREETDFYVEDLGSKLGTYVNGTRITARYKLGRNDQIDFGNPELGHIVFYPQRTAQPDTQSDTRELLSQISGMEASGEGADLERLTLFLEAAGKLNAARVLDDILVTLIDATLRLTRAERGFVFLREKSGKLRLAAARDSKGRALSADSGISQSILNKAVTSGSEFLVTDTSSSAELAGQMSIVALDLRTVICIPLLRHANNGSTEVSGALYLDSKRASQNLSTVSNDLLRTIAREAAALVENAELMQEQERARRYEQELAISATIQQRLMTVTIPKSSYARLQARNISCKEIGGDFFDVVATDDGIAAVLADVCGKGVSAALLASILQGMIYAQLKSSVPLAEIADVANRFLCQKDLGEKYATLTIARLHPNGRLEFLNCGHVPPFLITGGKITRTEPSNPPVGLLPGIPYTSEVFELAPGDRLVSVSDGITEAQNAAGDFFGDERLEEAIALDSFEQIFARVHEFCGDTPFNDDCTVLQLQYRPESADASRAHGSDGEHGDSAQATDTLPPDDITVS